MEILEELIFSPQVTGGLLRALRISIFSTLNNEFCHARYRFVAVLVIHDQFDICCRYCEPPSKFTGFIWN
jgi:hypothetical protein